MCIRHQRLTVLGQHEPGRDGLVGGSLARREMGFALGVQLGDPGLEQRRGRAEQQAQRVVLAARRSGQDAHGDVDRRRSGAPERDPVGISVDALGRQLQLRRRGWRGALAHPGHQRPQGRLGDDVQGPVVDPRAAVDGSGHLLAEQVAIGVRGAGDPPGPERAVSACSDAKEPRMPVTSLSVCSVNTGAVLSTRTLTGVPKIAWVMSTGPSPSMTGVEESARLCTRDPSKATSAAARRSPTRTPTRLATPRHHVTHSSCRLSGLMAFSASAQQSDFGHV